MITSQKHKKEQITSTQVKPQEYEEDVFMIATIMKYLFSAE